MNIRQHLGHLLMLTAAIHVALGVLLFYAPLLDIIQSGVFNSITPHYDRGMVVWFLLFGAVLFLLGQSAQWIIRSGMALPESVGWGLLLIAVLGGVLLPVSGFWLVLPQALFIINQGKRA